MVELETTTDFEDTSQSGPVAGPASRTVETVKVYTRHKRSCPKVDRPDWARCNCVKWLYVYRNGKCQLTSAKTRSWERAEQKARVLRDAFDPAKQLQRQLEAKINAGNVEVEIAVAVDQFNKEVARLSRAEATRSKYNLTLSRLLTWCATQSPAVLLLSQLDVPTLRRWIHSWTGAPTTRHNQHQRIIAFFNFCMEQGWIKENPAKKIKKVPRQQEETLPFTREQFEALIKATYYYDSRGQKRNGATTNSRRVRAYLKLLRWSGLRAGDGACLAKSKLRDDDSLVLYQAKVKDKANAPVCVLLPHEIAQELRNVPPSTLTNPNYFFWSGRSKRKSEVSNWIKIFGKILSKATELFPESFLESDGQPKSAHLHMLRDTFAVEYLLAGMSLEEVSRLLGHSSVLITQKHYAPWVLQRQQHLVASQRNAWANMGLEQKHHGPKATRRHRPRKARRQTSFHGRTPASAVRGRQ
jgi:integrase/recombinase XerD